MPLCSFAAQVIGQVLNARTYSDLEAARAYAGYGTLRSGPQIRLI